MMEEKVAELFPRYRGNTIKIIDYIRNNAGCTMREIADGIGKSDRHLRKNMKVIVNHHVVFPDRSGPISPKTKKPAIVYFLMSETEQMFEEHGIEYDF